ncbi:MAG TPA: HEAT repeat domain-containing protein [Vicinamibacterales bacterium]|nr:HEAT repeat domain-containing protein [Vicinamibacterales bacterium]
MPEATPLSPELLRSVSALARALLAAARTWMLYPPEHPAVRTSLDRFGSALRDASGSHPFAFGVTPETLLIDGTPAAAKEGPVSEAAAWLHHRDILQLAFAPDVPAAALERFLALLSEDVKTVRERGGPAKAWIATGHPSIHLEQLDFSKVLEDRESDRPARRKDDLWKAIVQAVVDRRKSLDEAIQKRMLEIAGDVMAIGDLAGDVMAPNCSVDGSPMLTSQAAAVVAAYRHLVGVVDVMAPERRAEVMQNLAAATSALDPRVVMQILGNAEQAGGGQGMAGGDIDVRRGIADAFDDTKVAQLLATTLAIDGQATDRLASAFDTIAPDDDRKQRVLRMTRSMLSETSFGKTSQFQTLWTSMEELLLSYNERPFVSQQYREGLDRIGARAEAMGASDIPPELAAMCSSLDQDNVRRLSVILLIDLLNLERDPARAPELARDVAALGEDLLLAGDYDAALDVSRALAARAADSTSVAAAGSRVALDGLVSTAAFHEAVDYLQDMDEKAAGTFGEVCTAIGPATTDALRQWLDEEGLSRARRRATVLITSFGTGGVKRLAALVSSPHWYARRNVADVLGEIASADGVPLLQALLRGSDPRVTQASVRALSNIDDPSAARSVHMVLRAAAGDQRQAVVAALVAERDPRVVPLLVRILDESDALGVDHAIVIETLGAVGTLGGDVAIPAVDRVIRKRKWFARTKVRALKEAGIQSLKQIATPAASSTLAQAAATGDRLLKRLARDGGRA